MNLSNNDAQLLINICKKLEKKVLSIPSGGNIEKYNATDLEGVTRFIYRMRQAIGNHSARHKATYNLFYNGYQLLRLDTVATVHIPMLTAPLFPHIHPIFTYMTKLKGTITHIHCLKYLQIQQILFRRYLIFSHIRI